MQSLFLLCLVSLSVLLPSSDGVPVSEASAIRGVTDRGTARVVNEPNFIASLNSKPGSWKAGENTYFDGMTVRDVKRLMGFRPDANQRRALSPKARIPLRGDTPIPPSFDARKTWPACVHPIRNQGGCGSCWAFGASESISDRFCTQSNGTQNFVLSVEELVDCNLLGLEACNGGDPITAMLYASFSGLVLDKCYPYVAEHGKDTACRHSSCVNSTIPWTKHHTNWDTLRWHPDVESMQRAIMTGGPIEACFQVYDDFMNYKSGVYVRKSDKVVGGHCIKIVGWGSDAGVPYWIAANSWGTSWADLDGFFWIIRGKNECMIEREAFSIDPKF